MIPKPLPNVDLDLITLGRRYQTGDVSPRSVLEGVLQRAAACDDPAVWIHLLSPDAVWAQVQQVERRRAAGEGLPLYGVPFAVKDNMDVAGCPTTAACPAFTYVPQRTAPVVERLQQCGAILIGKTNLDQFATGLAGDRSPYGACRNLFDRDYIAGGSSSGSGLAVAAGLVSFALGTDTAGSGRIPAGCNNIVGLKPTPGLFSTEGVVPACSSLDCVSILALTVDDAVQVADVVLNRRWPDPPAQGRDGETLGPGCCFATPRDEDLEFFGDTGQEHAFGQAIERLVKLGARRRPIDFRPFLEAASLLYDGPWVAERLAALGDFVNSHAADVLPVIRDILECGARYSAVDLFRATYRLQALRSECLNVFTEADVLVVPTLPALPRLADVQADSRGWSRRLGQYTNYVNLLGLAALAVPAGFTARGLPAGITLIGPGGSDRRLGELGRQWQRSVDLPLGATGRSLPEAPPALAPRPVSEGLIRVAVAGAHLRGQPLHPDLRRCGARFVRACRTAGKYRFLALLDLKPPRPGLLRDDRRAGAVAVEIYDLPPAGFGRLVASVAPPLAIGTIELADGETVKGFLCESFAAAGARDITDFGGWIAFLGQLADARAQGTGRRSGGSSPPQSQS